MSIGLVLLLFFIVLSCIRNDDETNNLVDSQKAANTGETSARFKATRSFATSGGSLSLSTSQIQTLCNQLNVSSEELRGLVIYTIGNENGDNDINIPNLKAVSLFHYDGNLLKHSFYKQNLSGQFENVTGLSSYCAGGFYEEINFAIYYSGIFRDYNNLTMYSVLNKVIYDTKTLSDPTNPNSDFLPSKKLLEKRAVAIGNLVKLDSTPSEDKLTELSMLYDSYRVLCCNHGYYQPISIFIQDIPEPPVPGEGPGETDPYDPPICPKKQADKIAGSSYATSDDIAYEIRDGVMYNNFFGLKYIEYYYNTSFYDCNLDYSDAIKMAVLVPKIYSLYSDYKNNRSEKIVFDDDLKNEIIAICESLKSKNSANLSFITVLNNVENDVNFLHNKSIQQLNEVLY